MSSFVLIFQFERLTIPRMHEQESPKTNCIGFAFSRLGITPEERYIEPPTLKCLLHKFNEVEIDKASLLAIIRYPSGEPYVYHLAILSEDKNMVIHRKGIDSPEVVEDIDMAICSYLLNNDSVGTKVIYLQPKAKFGSVTLQQAS